MRWGPVSLCARARAQLTAAKGIPVTTWTSGFAGLHFHFIQRADLWLGAGSFHYANGVDSDAGMLTELGLSFQFDPYLGSR